MKLNIYDCHETFFMFLRNISNITFLWSPCSIFYPFKNLVLTLLPSLFFHHHIHSWHSKCKLTMYIGNTHGCECVRMDRSLHFHHTIIIFNSMAYYSYILFRILFIFPAISFYSPFSICSSLFIMFITTPFFMWSVSFGCFINDQKLFTSHTY